MSANQLPYLGDFEVLKGQMEAFYERLVFDFWLEPASQRRLREILDDQLRLIAWRYGQAVNEPTGKFPLVQFDMPELPRPRGKVVGEIDADGAVYFTSEGCFERNSGNKIVHAVTDYAEMQMAAEHLENRQ